VAYQSISKLSQFSGPLSERDGFSPDEDDVDDDDNVDVVPCLLFNLSLTMQACTQVSSNLIIAYKTFPQKSATLCLDEMHEQIS
jgi:hypothetical protein